MTTEIPRSAAGNDHNADVRIACEFLQALRECVAHFGVEIDALRAPEGYNGDSFGDFCR